MGQDQPASPRRVIIELLTNRRYMTLQVCRFTYFVCMQMLSVTVAWQVYDLTGNALDLGYVGLSIFLPSLIFSAIGGDLADRLPRSLLAGAGYGMMALCSAGLAYVSRWAGAGDIGYIYGLLVLTGMARSLGGPAGSALLPELVRSQVLGRAIAMGSTAWQLATIVGPSLGGLAYSFLGHPERVYWIGVAAFACSAIGVWSIRSAKPENRSTQRMLDRLREGVRFVRSTRPLVGAISLDLFAVLLGGAVALLPVYARDILDAGPEGLGLLRSGPAIGAALMAVLLGFVPMTRHAGRKMFLAVVVFGLATCVFALSKSFWLSMGALVVLGAADMISVVIRHTLVLNLTPDAMRGRVSAVNQVFIGASNELGEFESGLTAHWFGVVPAALIGGIGTILVAISYWFLFPSLKNISNLEDVAELRR